MLKGVKIIILKYIYNTILKSNSNYFLKFFVHINLIHYYNNQIIF
jgi:hypothetical protein